MIDEIIQKKIAEISAGLGNYHPWERAIATRYQLLPLYADFGGAIAINSNLEIVVIPDDPNAEMHIEPSLLWRNVGLIQGSKKHPELKALIPQKPSDGIDCPDCNGAGMNPITAVPEYRHIICRCGGAGWLPKE